MDTTTHPPSGLWTPNPLGKLYFGPDIVRDQLLSVLPSSTHSKAAIITGTSLATKTPLITELEGILGPAHHGFTFSAIKAHAPIADVRAATQLVFDDSSIDTLVAVGGGTPIDAAKLILMHVYDMRQERRKEAAATVAGDEAENKYLKLICIPTTLSAAECTAGAGYTDENGEKKGLARFPFAYPTAVFYDPHYASYTPSRLWLASGLRALDHAVELMYHPRATDTPCKSACAAAAATLCQYLPLALTTHPGSGRCDPETTILLLLAAFNSLHFVGGNLGSGLGLSHALGYALGAPYGIPHGETSCLTLGHVIKLKARMDPTGQTAEQIARLEPYVTGAGKVWRQRNTSAAGEEEEETKKENVESATRVGDAVLKLVERLGLKKSLTEYGVGRDQVDIIVSRALGGTVGGAAVRGVDPGMRDEVRKLVEGLF